MEKEKDVKITEHKDGPNGVKYFTYEEVEKEPIKMDLVDLSKDLLVGTYYDKQGLRVYQIGLKKVIYESISAFIFFEKREVFNSDKSIMRSTEEVIFFNLLLSISNSLSNHRSIPSVGACVDEDILLFNLTHPEMAALNRFCQIWQLRLKPEEEGSFEHQCLIAMNTILAPLVTMY